MSFTIWVAVLGAVLLILALTSSYLRWLPITTSLVCLALGVLIGPAGVGLLQLDIRRAAGWMENLTEVALLFSLFVSGLKMRLPLGDRSWWVALCLAGPVLVLGILGVALVLHLLLGLDWSFALLLGAILAPTDPVLASMVQVNDAQDHDRVRFGLSGEAGLNDGMAFAFVILGVLLLKQDSAPEHWLMDWVLYGLIWAIPAGLVCGYGLGHGLGRLTLRQRTRHADSSVSPNDYLSLALIALAYVAAELVHGYGFLSVFAAGLGLRQAEVNASSASHPPAEHLVQPLVGHQQGDPRQSVHGDVQALEERQVAAGIMLGDMLSFGSLVERAMEVFIVTLLGVVLPAHWDWRALGVGALLFLVVRPLCVLAMPWGTLLDRHQRLLLGWFGIRGIGSLYYLFYALNHPLEPTQATLSVQLTLSVVALSILVHGLSAQPLLLHYQRHQRQAVGDQR